VIKKISHYVYVKHGKNLQTDEMIITDRCDFNKKSSPHIPEGSFFKKQVITVLISYY